VNEIAQYRGTGKRKTSVARVILRPGDGTTWFNGRTIEDYFPRATHRDVALAPPSKARSTCASASTVEGRAARRARCVTASPARSSRPIQSCACR
jgi:ribosomal protein S9